MAKETKSTNAEITRRVSVISGLLLAGYRRPEILQYVANNTNWKLSNRQIDEYIKKAHEDIAIVLDEEKHAAFGSALARLNRLYKEAMDIDDFKTALQVQKEINELYHLKDTEQKTDHVVNITFANNEGKML